MTYKFTVKEESGEKLYKLIVIRFPDQSGVKFISKENLSEKIHFIIYFGTMNPVTGDFTVNKIHHTNKTNGITKENFDNLICTTLSKMTDDKEVAIHDLSKYKNLKEQYEYGLNEGFMKVTDFAGELSNDSEIKLFSCKDQIMK